MKTLEIKPGQKAIYYSIVRDNGERLAPKEVTLSSGMFHTNNGPAVNLEGKSGYYMLKHISLIEN